LAQACQGTDTEQTPVVIRDTLQALLG